MNAVAVAVWVAAGVIVWLAYTPLAHWVTLEVPYSHFLLVPGGSTAVPVATVAVVATFLFLKKKGSFTGGYKWGLIAIGSLPLCWWIFATGFYVVIMLRGGL